MEIVDLRGKNYFFGNICEKLYEIQNRLAAVTSLTYSLNISDNYLDDYCIETLLPMLSNETANDHNLVILDLTNNSITQNGIFMLAPLLMRNDFKWLVAPANEFGLDGIGALQSDFRQLANKISCETDMDSNALFDDWISKVIWVPESFTDILDRLPLAPVSRDAHRQYYTKEE